MALKFASFRDFYMKKTTKTLTKSCPKDLQSCQLSNSLEQGQICIEKKVFLFFLQVRKRSKACRAGLREADELVSINEQPCGSLSHAQAMNLIDSSPGILNIRVKRSEENFNFIVD